MDSITGDLIDLAETTDLDVIVHGCNCFCTWGAGIAKTIRDRYPDAYAQDCNTVKGDKAKLGGYTWQAVKSVQNTWWFVIVNGYTQFRYGKGIHVDYNAVTEVFRGVARDYSYARIAYPKIGAGLAGGDWGRISSIIDKELDGLDHTLVVL